MTFHIDLIFKSGSSYDTLVALIEGNPRFIFAIKRQDKIDKRTKKSKETGWVEIKHANKSYKGVVKLTKNGGVCRATVNDQSGGLRLIGAWTSWLASNASDLISGVDVRFEKGINP